MPKKSKISTLQPFTDQESAIDIAEMEKEEEEEDPNAEKSKISTLQPFTHQESAIDIAEVEGKEINLSLIKNPPIVEVEVKEANSERSNCSSPQPLLPPWADLPDLVTDLILQRLPLPDYIRFAGICRDWRFIQNGRRRRHFPYQPPMFSPIPWLIPGGFHEDSNLDCYSPFDRKFYCLQRIHRPSGRCMFSCHGWMLYAYIDDSPAVPSAKTFPSYSVTHYRFSLINPITAAIIELPSCSLCEDFPFTGAGTMSAPPADPNCTVLLIDEDNVFIYWVNNEDGYDSWLRLHLPLPAKLPRNAAMGTTTVFSSGRFCISESRCYYAVDPVLPKPLVQVFEMDVGEIPWSQWSNYLIDFDGEVLLAVTLKDPAHPVSDLEGFQVYRPGYAEVIWVRVDSLGDRALFMHTSCCFSLVASDVGCKKNCIYHPKSFAGTELARDFVLPGDLFGVFDLGTGRWIDDRPYCDAEVGVDLWSFVHEEGIWLLPRLDHVNPEKTSDAGGVSSSQDRK